MFVEFPKIARLNRECVITEKIDGTNAQIVIGPLCSCRENESCAECVPADKVIVTTAAGYKVYAGSRTRWLTPEQDNFGFAKWVRDHADELVEGLGLGRHYGEWWGSGIQRGYGLTKGEKRFSLFNVARWAEKDRAGAPLLDGQAEAPGCCHVVPVMYKGPFTTVASVTAIDVLRTKGSLAAAGFMRPEGIIVYHTAAKQMFKVTCEKDEQPKSLVK